MQVLIKADGFPTYHMAVVVDDHLMRITHILRGEDWISSVPKHVLLYQYFGWEPPVFCHLPLLRNPDRSKLSKRRNPTSINYYRRAGYLPEALINYLGRMGWSMPDEREMFGRDEMIDAFDLKRISLGGPVFDLAKLNWLNGQYIRKLSPHEFLDRVRDWAFRDDQLEQLVPLVQERTERLIDLVPLAGYLVGDRRAVTVADFAHKDLAQDDVKRMLQFVVWWLDEVREWERDALQAGIQQLAVRMGLQDPRLSVSVVRCDLGPSGVVAAVRLDDGARRRPDADADSRRDRRARRRVEEAREEVGEGVPRLG